MTDQKPKANEPSNHLDPEVTLPEAGKEVPEDTGQADYGSAGQQEIDEVDGTYGRDR